jgi:uncharacterized caspase-like protein
MTKVALLIGVSDYEPGFNPLPGAVRDVEALQRVLQNAEIGKFDQVEILTNPDPLLMQEKIESLFADRSRDDLALLFFSGHGIKDERGKLYFATPMTRKTHKGGLIKSSAVPASFIHEVMSNSRSKRQVVLLDCCFSGAFAEGMSVKDDGTVPLQEQLGGEGRAILTSTTSTQYAFEQQGEDLSIYTHYIVEGLETGAADQDNDGTVSVRELHEYAKRKVQEAAPAMKPEIYQVREGSEILLAHAPVGDPKLRYRKEVERFAERGEISNIIRFALEAKREGLGLTPVEAAAIEMEVLQPSRQRQQNLQRYEQQFIAAILRESPLSSHTRSELKYLQQTLGLTDEDVFSIEAQYAARMGTFPPGNPMVPTPVLAPVESQDRIEAPPTAPPTTPVAPLAHLKPSTPSLPRFIAFLCSRRFFWGLGISILILAALVGGNRALIAWRTEQEVRLAIQQAEALQKQGGLRGALADMATVNEIRSVLEVYDLQSAKRLEQSLTSPYWKAQAGSMISAEEYAIGEALFQEIQSVLDSADDIKGAQERAQKITSSYWRQKADALIAEENQNIIAVQIQQREAEERARIQAQQAAERARIQAERARRAAAAAAAAQQQQREQNQMDSSEGTNAPSQSTPSDGSSNSSNAGPSFPQDNMPQNNMPQNNMPQNNMP